MARLLALGAVFLGLVIAGVLVLMAARAGDSEHVVDPAQGGADSVLADGSFIPVADVEGNERLTVAEELRFDTLVIAAPSETKVCVRSFIDPVPPGCDGIVARSLPDGVTWDDSSPDGTSWAWLEVLVSWPPVDGSVDVLAVEPAARPEPERRPHPTPEGCATASDDAPSARAPQFPDELAAGVVGTYRSDEGVWVVLVDGDPAAHQQASDVGVCVLESALSPSEFRGVMSSMLQLYTDPTLAVVQAYGPVLDGRVVVVTLVADQRVAEAVAAATELPDAVLLLERSSPL